MLNGSGAYGNSATSVTGTEKPAPPSLTWWLLPRVVWRPEP